MAKRGNQPKIVTVTKPKRKRSCLSTLMYGLIGLLILYALSSNNDRSSSGSPTPDRNATRTVAAAIASENRQAATSAPTATTVKVAQDNTSIPTDNPTGTANVILETTNAAAATERAVNNAISLTRLAAQITPSATITNTAIPATAPPTQAPAQTWYTTSNANARSCASTNCDIVTTISNGTRVDVVGEEQGETVSGSANWKMVIAGGQVTYVHSSLLSRTAPQPIEQAQSQPINPASQLNQQSIPQQPSDQNQSSAPSWTCSGDIYNCGDFNTCAEVMAYFNACPGDPSRLDQGGIPGVPCESLCK